ncbi:hypothetical protein C8N32_105114 [Rhodovulum imhoffii]|uniref:Uncharacterized protein n=1 Tax=Rhodovulum imhoffii TaxID=365340 RepID=A0A2T5BTI9_9RHOB|nr:hypothetical protein [Rhodovulum imhoffii]MBK5934310.1 hypothetical protein [Rhodovulum imhoffii]PTN02742.1 hypothetical protein C8N32_105114 [Rhodovulum imhoffii]
MRNNLWATAFLGLCTGAALAGPDSPLSAIDWLSDSVIAPPSVQRPEPRVTPGAAPEDIAVTRLGAPNPDAVGLLSPAVSGLPRNLWGNTPTAELARLIGAEHARSLPALQDLLYTLLLAEIDPPADNAGDGELLVARLDKLLDMGALDQAQALVERAGPDTPTLFRRWFDISLLTGQEDRACAAMRTTPDIAPTFPARIFCLARGGAWDTAVLTLGTARALGFITEEEDTLLARFLDPDLFEGEPPLPAPTRPSPLVFRIREAIGEPLPTSLLPRAFARADLRPTAGWKTRIEASERLARTGALPASALMGVYTEREPAASGGIWDRVAAVQALDRAVMSGEAEAVTQALPTAWQQMEAAGLTQPLAQLYGPRLAPLPLSGPARELAIKAGLLSPDYETVAVRTDATLRFARGVAQGRPDPALAQTPMETAISEAFTTPDPGPANARRLKENRVGEAILNGIITLAEAAGGETSDVVLGLSTLRMAGLESTARRAALEILLTEARP